MAGNIRTNKFESADVTGLYLVTIMLIFVSGIALIDPGWALEQEDNQFVAKSDNFTIYSLEIKKNNDEARLTTRSQDAAVNEVISFFNEPRNDNQASAVPCLTDDFRCCIVNSTVCVPVAIITSVIDSDGKPVPFGGVSDSKEITFVFTSFIRIGAILFECSLDHSSFKPCASPLTVTNVSTSPIDDSSHEFEVRMSGMDPKDSPWARFMWFSDQS